MITFQQFQEGMSSDEIEEKLKYVKLVLSVAKEMGKAETISSLIPFQKHLATTEEVVVRDAVGLLTLPKS